MEEYLIKQEIYGREVWYETCVSGDDSLILFQGAIS